MEMRPLPPGSIKHIAIFYASDFIPANTKRTDKAVENGSGDFYPSPPHNLESSA